MEAITLNWKIRHAVDLLRGFPDVNTWKEALMVPGDDEAHTWEVEIREHGQPVNLTGCIVNAWFVREDGNAVYIVGTTNDNVAMVTLTHECYAIPGQLRGVMKVLRDGHVMSACEAFFTVRESLPEQCVVPSEVVTSIAPHIGQNGNWYFGDSDTGVKAIGVDGTTPHIGSNGNWYIGEVDTGLPSRGAKGVDGADAPQIADNTISSTNPWSSAKIVDALCPPFEVSGNPVTCYPVAGSPLNIKAQVEPVQHFDWVSANDVAAGAYCVVSTAPNGGYWSFTLSNVSDVEIDTYAGNAHTVSNGVYTALATTHVASSDGLTALNAVSMGLTAPDPDHPCAITVAESVHITHNDDVYDITLSNGFAGGEVDVTGGCATGEWGKIVLDGGRTYTRHLHSNGMPYIEVNGVSTLHTTGENSGTLFSSHHKQTAWTTVSGRIYSPDGKVIIIVDERFTDSAAIQAIYAANPEAIYYKRTTPVQQSVTPTPITALTDCNTITTDADTLTVSGRADPIHIITRATTSLAVPIVAIPYAPTITIAANTMSNIATLTGACTISLGAGDEQYDNEWDFTITQGDTAQTLTLPTIAWNAGIAPTFAANTTTVCRLYYIGATLHGIWEVA